MNREYELTITSHLAYLIMANPSGRDNYINTLSNKDILSILNKESVQKTKTDYFLSIKSLLQDEYHERIINNRNNKLNELLDDEF